MGTQQIFLLVIAVIIIGVGVATGVNMFHRNADNQARQNLVSEMVSLANQSQTWFRTSRASNGGGSEFNTTAPPGSPPNTPPNNMASLMRFIDSSIGANNTLTNSVGTFVFTVPSGTAPHTMTITGSTPRNPRVRNVVVRVNLNGTGANRGIEIVL